MANFGKKKVSIFKHSQNGAQPMSEGKFRWVPEAIFKPNPSKKTKQALGGINRLFEGLWVLASA